MDALEMSAQAAGKGTEDFEWTVYHKFNKNLKARYQFIHKIMDWNEFSESLLNQDKKSMFGNRWLRAAQYANPNLLEEANAKNHFSIQKTTL